MAIHANGRQMSPLEDIARSTVTGLERGVTGTLGLPNELGGLSDWASLQGAKAGNWLVGGGGNLTPQQRQTALDVNHVLQHASPFGMINSGSPSQASIDRHVQQVAGPYHAPQTMPGRFAETAGEFAGGALTPGGPAAKVARVAIPALAAQGAAELAPDNLKPYAKLAGGFVGGGIEGGMESIGQAPARALARTLPPQLDDDTIQTIAALRQAAQGHGIDLTIPEATAQVTGNAAGTNLQRTLENSARLRPTLSPYFAQRPDQVRGAVTGFVGDMTPSGVPTDPGMLGLAANRAAQGAQMDANSFRGQASRAAGYDAADQDQVDRGGIADILQGLTDRAAADKTGLLAPRINQVLSSFRDASGQPITDIGNLSTARNFWRDQIDLPPGSADSIPKLQAGIIGDHLDDLDKLLAANPNFAQGQAVYGAASRHLVDPLASGPAGVIGRTDDLSAQLGALFPQNPPMGQAGSTARALSALGAQDTGLSAALTGQQIGTQFNQSARDLVGGPNQWGGARFVRDIAGNDEQGATLQGAFDTIDPTGALSAKWHGLADALAATGTRQAAGSQTASYLENQNILHRAPAAMRLLGAIGDPLEWTKNLSNWTGGQLYGHNLDALADMIRDPDTAAVLARAQAAGPSAAPVTMLLPAATGQGAPSQ